MITSFSAKICSTTPTFFAEPTIYSKNNIIKHNVKMNNYKRQYREIDDEVKAKISNSSRNKPKSAEHKMHISQAMEKYWQTVPHRPDDNNNEV